MSGQVSPPKKRWTVGAALWLSAMVIMATFQTWRGAYEDGALFYALALGLFIDRSLGETTKPNFRPTRIRFEIIVSVAAITFLILVLAPRHGSLVFIVMVIIGCAMLFAAWFSQRQTASISSQALRRSAWTWGLLVIALCIWEALAFILSVTTTGASEAHPTVSVLLDPALNTLAGRIVFVGLWLGAGVGMFMLWRKSS